MDLYLLTHAAALIALLGTAAVYGTDVFCAIVLRPALESVDDATLVAVMGRVHRYGDKRMTVPGVVGIVATVISTVLAAVAGHGIQAAAAGIALVALSTWLALYAAVSAPINKQMTGAADAGESLSNGRALQAKWDSIINTRAILQAIAVAALGAVLIL
ncbi:MAG: DUF1772 domain-containing protein [Rhodococcus sp. (in: high G+C Gram-positive bacteria)]